MAEHQPQFEDQPRDQSANRPASAKQISRRLFVKHTAVSAAAWQLGKLLSSEDKQHIRRQAQDTDQWQWPLVSDQDLGAALPRSQVNHQRQFSPEPDSDPTLWSDESTRIIDQEDRQFDDYVEELFDEWSPALDLPDSPTAAVKEVIDPAFDHAIPQTLLTAGLTYNLHQAIIERSHQDPSKPSPQQYQAWRRQHDSTQSSSIAVDFETAIDSIKQLPSEQKLQSIQDLKRAYVDLRTNMADIQKDMAGLVETNPDISSAELQASLQQQLDQKAIPQSIKELSLKALQEFVERRDKVNQIKGQSLSPTELIESQFGFTPQGQVDVEYMPINIYLTIHNSEDYRQLFGKDHAAASGGFYRSGDIFSYQNGSAPEFVRRKIRVHENQHAIYDTLHDSLDLDLGLTGQHYTTGAYLNITHIRQPDQWARAVTDILRQTRYQAIDNRAKNELLAYITDPDLDAFAIHGIMLRPEYDGGLYDYQAMLKPELDQLKEGIRNNTLASFQPGTNVNQLIDQSVQQVYLLEYSRLLQAALEVVDNLTYLGYPKQEVIQLLTLVELRHWPALERKLLSQISQTKGPSTADRLKTRLGRK